jgi:hypothetical protein
LKKKKVIFIVGTRNALCWRLVSEENGKMSLIILDSGEEGSREAIDNRG